MPDRTPPRTAATRPDHVAAPPSGSSQTAIEAPRSRRGTIGLLALAILIVAVLLVAFLFADDAPPGAEVEAVIVDGDVVVVSPVSPAVPVPVPTTVLPVAPVTGD